jgi:hypothetical protein
MRKSDNMVSLNPEYGIEVTAIGRLADKVKDDNPEVYAILTILIASILGKDERRLLEYCNKYLEDKIYLDKLKNSINDMLDNQQDKLGDDFGDDLFNY